MTIIKRVLYCILTISISLLLLSMITNDFKSDWENNRLKEKIQASYDLQMTNVYPACLVRRNDCTGVKCDLPRGTNYSTGGAYFTGDNESAVKDLPIWAYVLPYSRNGEFYYNLSRYYERILEILLANKQKLVTQNHGEQIKSQIPNLKSQISKLISNLYSLSISECQKAIHINPVKSDYHVKLAQLYARLLRVSPPSGQTGNIEDQAINQETQFPISRNDIVTEFERSIVLNPNHDYPHQMYANWLFDEMKNSQLSTDNVFMEYKTVLSLNPSRTNEVLEKFMSITHDYSELKKLLDDNPENHCKLADFLQRKGYWHQNVPAFLNDMERTRSSFSNSQTPGFFQYYWVLASGLMKDGERKKAIELLREYIKDNEKLVVDDFISQDSYPQSKIQNSKSVNHYDLAKAHFWIADWAFYGGKKHGYGWDFVKYHHLKALGLDPENNFYRLWYAIHLYYKKEYKLAMKHLNIILKENPEHAVAHFRLGQCYERLDILDIALKHYKKAISLSPDNEEYKEHYNNLRE